MPRKKTGNKSNLYRFELSIVSLLFWGVGLFVLLAWIFILGILVGRGYLPEEFQLTKLKDQLLKRGEESAEQEQKRLEDLKALENHPELEFYDELTAKKREAEKAPTPIVKRKVRKKPEETPQETIEKAPEPEPQSLPQDRTQAGKARFTVQVAAFENGTQAVKMVNELDQKGYPAYFYKIEVKGKTYFRVRCGKFQSKGGALDFKKTLERDAGVKGFVAPVEQ